MSTINLSRNEVRLIIPEKFLVHVYECLKRHGFASKSFDRPIVQTVYHSDDQQTHAIGYSFRSRRYVSERSRSFSLSVLRSQAFEFEIKQDGDRRDRKIKTPRQKMTLEEANEYVQKFMRHEKIRPYLIAEYLREHFLFGSCARITLDHGLSFFHFFSDFEWAARLERRGEERCCRIEIKYEEAEVSRMRAVIAELKNLGALPVVSKKIQGFNLLRLYLDANYGYKPIVKDIKGVEIETKFTLSGEPDTIFSALYHHGLDSFYLDSYYPFLVTGGSINHYWGRDEKGKMVEGAKALCRGSMVNFVHKSGHAVLSKELGMIERNERKLPWFEYNGTNFVPDSFDGLHYQGHISRTRKAFWLRGPEKRLYHFSIDLCKSCKGNSLCQLEIEFTGRVGNDLPRPSSHGVVVEELNYLGNEVLNFLTTQPTTVEPGCGKFQWMVG